MEPKDLQHISMALKLVKISQSLELMEATEEFFESLSFAPFSKHLIPVHDRLNYELHVARARTKFLMALLST
jgi:hypothetical protein